MCGIAGIVYADDHRPPDPMVLKGMADAIAHRGPDAEGFWIRPGIGLAHRRLSIIDLAGGDQPMGNEDQSVQVVFNGEIYNYRALRDDLQSRGHLFRTHCDTEVLVHLYEEYADGMVEHLRGMFAFALWDTKRRRLVLARDRVGIKPLYWLADEEKLLFGSELKAILAYPGISREIDPESLESYLAFGMVPGSRAIFRGIQKFPAAHVLTLQAGSWRHSERRFWQLQFQPDESVSINDWSERIALKVQEAVRLHLAADVRVGSLLSGGIDSSVVVAEASAAASPLWTFSMGFEDKSWSELPFARQVASRFDTVHHEEIVTPDAVSLLDELARYFDEPFADSSALPTFLVSRLASRSVKVVLSGDGGDEAFGGYARYAHDLKEAALRRMLPDWLRRGALGPLGTAWPKAGRLPRWLRAKTALTNLALDSDRAYANSLAVCRPPLRRRLMHSDLAAVLNGYDPGRIISDGGAQARSDDYLGRMIAADVAVTLPDDYLVKVDRASMAWGLEVRPPLLDHELLEMCAVIPSKFKIRQGQTKWILKQSFRQRLPASLLVRRKQGFELPLDKWLRFSLRDMFEAEVLSPGSPVADLIDRRMARRLYEAHLYGAQRNGPTLWSLLVLAIWARRYLKTPVTCPA